MADINYDDLPQKTTASVPWDFVIITDSEDWDIVKIQDATLFKWPTGDTWPQWPQGIQGIQWIQGIQGNQWPQGIQWVAGTDWTNISWVTSNKVWKTTTVTVAWDFAWAPSTFDIEDWADWTWSWDVMWPATNTDSYIPQWDWADSKTLKNWIPTSTFAPALWTDDNYVTDAEKIVIWNTSWTNSWDNSANSNSWLVHTSWDETIWWTKTFSSDVIVPYEAYSESTWNWSNEVPTKDAIRDKFESLGWWANLTWTDLLTAWENMSAGIFYRKWAIVNTISQETSANNQTVWYNTTTDYETWQSITWAWWGLQAIDLWMLRQWTPNHIWNVEIFSDSGFSTLVATSTNSITASTLTTSAEKVTFLFSWYNPWAVTLYFKLNLVSWTVSTSNFSYVSYNTTSVYAWWQKYYINSWWTPTGQTQDLKFNVYSKYETLTSYFKAEATLAALNKVQWVIKTTVTAWNTFYGNLWWEQAGYTSLTEWEVYYLKDDWTIWTTAWTTTVKVGRAISTTKINFIPPL